MVDEAAFCGEDLFEELVLPLALQEDVATMFVTTPGPQDSWLMQAVQQVHSSAPTTPIIPVISAYTPCDLCKTSLSPGSCLHNLNDRAPSKTSTRSDMLKPLFRDQQRFLAENYGLAITPSDRCFDAASVMYMLNRPPIYVPPMVRYVFVGIDPAEGGRNHFAITAQVCVGANEWAVSGRIDVFNIYI